MLGEAYFNTALLELLEHDLWVNEVAREPMGTMNEGDVQQPIGSGVAQGIQAWTIEPRTAEAIVDVATLRRDQQPDRKRRRLERGDLRVDRLLLLLTCRRDARVESCTLHHPSTPSLLSTTLSASLLSLLGRSLSTSFAAR